MVSEKSMITVRQYATEIFMPTKEIALSENTRSTYQIFLNNHIFPVIGDFYLSDVTPPVLNKLLIDFQKKGYAYGSTIKLYNILNGIFKMAFFDYSIESKPMERVLRPIRSRTEICKQEYEKSLTVEQLRYCLSCLENESLKWKTYITLCADSGCRRGELCGLQWQDIDWKDCTKKSAIHKG